MGTDTQLSITLPNDSAFYVAVKAYDKTGESDFSNIVSVKGKNSSTAFIDGQTFNLTDMKITKDPTLYDTGWDSYAFTIDPHIRDLDSDGDSDVVLSFGIFAQNRADDVTYYPAIFENLGDGTLKRIDIQGQYAATSKSREVEFADLNQDGHLDVIMANQGYDGPDVWDGGSYGSQNILLMSNADGTYTDASYILPQEEEFTHSLTVGDVNSDGYPDIYMGDMTSYPNLLINNNGESFTDTYLPDLFTQNWTSAGVLATSSHFTDIDDDGILEIVLGVSGENGNPSIRHSVIVKQDGNGNFDGSSYITLPYGRYGSDTINLDVDSADINGDGLMDLLMTQSDSDPYYEGREFQILIQQTDGSFVDETDTRIIGFDTDGYWVKFASFVDVDHDGDLDIVHISNSWDQVQPTDNIILYNDGNGVFTSYADYGYATNMTEGYYAAYDKDLGTLIGVVFDTNIYDADMTSGDVFIITELVISFP